MFLYLHVYIYIEIIYSPQIEGLNTSPFLEVLLKQSRRFYASQRGDIDLNITKDYRRYLLGLDSKTSTCCSTFSSFLFFSGGSILPSLKLT